MATSSVEELRCSFCSKPRTEVGQLVAGPGVYICDQCVSLADTVIGEHRDKKADPRLPTWESLTDEQMLDHIPRVVAVVNQVETDLRSWVQELRRRGVTWARIGEALGMTRQSAWERFSGEE
ncbi:ClpX C4-type zinc finger protein [Sphaerisporangium rubeum]|uniref:ClpX-type ZB domain-containing protein n=1 Tax=Sphaerisporangium rubeum TaxID=321317 RepID=A0A7X0M841_9ACTN|nr:ClpX C4-type zinc finger protein [Sphaerisporangium rubeum]MBB6473674.1 hypothetical protein [Sphaerisporangium rubeum]